MSVDLYAVCINCREELHIGQNDYIYTGEKYIKDLEKFVLKHRTEKGKHTIKIVNEGSLIMDIVKTTKKPYVDFIPKGMTAEKVLKKRLKEMDLI